MTASIITAASMPWEGQRKGHEHDQRQQHEAAGSQRSDRRSCSRRFVQRAGRTGSGHRHPLKDPRPGIRHPCAIDSLFTSNAVTVARRGRWRRRRFGRTRSAAARPRRCRSSTGASGRDSSRAAPAREPRGTWPTSATPCAPRSKSPDATSPPTTSTSAPRTAGAPLSQSENHAKRHKSHDEGRPVDVAETLDPGRQLSPRTCRSTTSPSASDSSPSYVDRCAGEKPVITAFERKRAIHPIRTLHQHGQDARDEGDRRDELRRVLTTEVRRQDGAARHRCSDELGPVEMCREVQRARR